MARDNANLERLLHYLGDCSEAELNSRLSEFKVIWRQRVVRQQGLQPQLVESSIKKGEEAFSLLSRAIQLLRLKNEKIVASDWLSRAATAFHSQDYVEALRLYERAFLNQPPNLEALSFAATSALRIQALDKAEFYLEQAMEINSFDVKVLVLSGLLCMEKQKFAEAGRHFKTALTLEPGSEKIKAYLAKADRLVAETPSVAQKNSKPLSKRINKRRQWIRKPVQVQLIINDFESVAPTTFGVSSLSAGGALVEGLVPDEFRFVLSLSDKDQIYGQAKRIYSVNSEQSGILFEGLNPDEQDLINHYVLNS